MNSKYNDNIHYLTADKTSWYLYVPNYYPSTEELINTINSEKPPEYHKIRIHGKYIDIPRYQQSYGKDYAYTGAVSMSKPIIPLIDTMMNKFIEDDIINYLRVNKLINKNMPNKYNMCLVNWYDHGNHHIGYHSDDERQLLTNTQYFHCLGEKLEHLL